MKKRIVPILIALAIIFIVGNIAYRIYSNLTAPEIQSFKECVDAGNPVMGEDPRECTANGKVFTEGEKELIPRSILDEEENAGSTEKYNSGSDGGAIGPAARYCEDHDGKIEIRSGDDGSYGVCVFDDGSECEQWTYYKGNCKKGENDQEIVID